MEVTFDYLSQLFTEFALREEELDDSRMTILNALADGFVNEDRFGDQTQYAKALVIAHHIKLSDLKSRGGVTSEKVGDEARTYSTPAEAGGTFKGTSYGAMFEEIRAVVTQGARRVYPPGRG